MITSQRLKNIFALFSLFALTLASFFAVCHLFTTMPEMDMGEHVNTPYLSMSAAPTCCQNTGMNHNLRLSMIETITKNVNVDNTLLTFGMFLVAWFVFGAVNLNKLFKTKIYYSHNREYWFNNYIFATLSRGILQPKLYSI